MSNKIIININEANKSQKFSTDGLFQIEAFKKVTEILKEHSHSSDIDNITDCRFHDTIFINGDRGVGKTAFMLNIEKYYNDINNKTDKQKYLFLDPVDPTLLEHSEKFLSVILARIVEKITSTMYRDNTNIEDENYFRALEKLSKSLSAIKTLPDDLGIEEIASNKSSLKLEQHAHEFFRVVCTMFKVDALVMLIDDVDMAFEKGFDVLEVVRKYLASPFIIPVVAGDMNLYREIVETKFMEKIEFSKDVKYLSAIHSSSKELIGSEEYTKKKNLIDSLVEQYLRKIFPNEYQIQLKDIFSVLERHQVIIKLDENLEIPYNKIKIFETRHINLGINQDEFYFQVFSNNTRDFIQYLYSKKDIYKGYFKNIDKDDFMDNMNLYKDSFRKTAEFYKFSHNKKKKELSILADNDYRSFENNKYSLYEAFINKQFLSMKKFHNIEKAVDKYSIKAKGLQTILNRDDGYKNISNYIIDLFVFNDYYSSYQRRNYIYSGNFLESIIYSLSINKKQELIKKKWIDDINCKIDNYLKNSKDSIGIFHDSEIFRDLNDEIYSILYDTSSKDARDSLLSEKFNNFKVDDESLKKYSFSLKNIAYKIPFGSEFLTNKRYKDEDFEDAEELYESQNKYDLNELSRAIVIWRNVFLNNIELNSISMYEILYKFLQI